MKKYLYIFVALVAMISIASCEKDKTEVNTTKNISVVSSSLAFDNTGGTGTIVVEATGTVSAVSDKAWAQPTVNGKTITVTCEPWDQLETRNAKITLTCAGESLDITAIQMGVVFAMEGASLTDEYLLYGETDTYTYSYSSNAALEVETDTEWLTVECDNEAKTVTVTPSDNTEMATRHGSFIIKVGSVEKEYAVSQYPQFKETADWVVTLAERGETQTSLKATVKASHGYYYLGYATPGTVKKAASVAEFVSKTLVPGLRAELDEAVAYYNYRYGYTSFMTNKTDTWTLDVIPDGDYVGFMVGFDSDGYPTGWYGATELFIGEVTPYMKWLGTWMVPHGEQYEQWVIEQKEEDKTYWVSGMCGMDPDQFATGAFKAEVKFDAETEELVVAVWDNTGITWTDASRGEMHTMLSGQYTNVAGKTYYNSGVGTEVARIKLDASGESAVITPGTVTSGGAPATFFNIKWYGRYLKSGSWSGVSWTGVETPISAGMIITKQ